MVSRRKIAGCFGRCTYFMPLRAVSEGLFTDSLVKGFKKCAKEMNR